MGRKSYEGTGVLPGLEDDVRPTPPASRPAPKKAANARSSRFSMPRLIATFAGAFIFLGLVLYGFHRLEQFLIMDPRFALSAPGDGSSLEIDGAAHASPASIEKIVGDDTGASVYLFPLAELPDAIRDVAWVR